MHDGTPRPLRSRTGPMRDALGKTKTMKQDTWVWLIGMTGAGDEELRQWAQSFSHPPALQARGAKVEAEPYAIARRALCLTVENKAVAIAVTPSGRCVNPVFELRGAPGALREVRWNDELLPADRYRWDGATLWLVANLDRPATLALTFSDAAKQKERTTP